MESPRRGPGAGTGVSLIAAAAGALGVPTGVWVFTLILGIILTLVALVPRTRTSESETAHQSLPPVSYRSSSTRHLVAVNPQELIRPFRNYGAEEASRLVRSYIGSWTQIEGVVPDESIFEWDRRHDVALGLRRSSTPSIYVRLAPNDPLKGKRWRPGEKLKVLGRIEEVGPSEVVLADCESDSNTLAH